MDILILCGGLATRLRPITEKIPKSMVEVNGKEFLEYLLDIYGEKFENVYLLAGFLGEKLKKYENYKIKVIIEKERLGTGGAVISILDRLQNEFIVVNGDTIVDDLDLDEFMKFSKNKPVSIYLVEDNASEKGIVMLDGEIVTDFLEKKSKENGKVYTGIVYFKKEELTNHNPKPCSMEKEIFPELIENNKLYGFVRKGKIYDIGTINGLEAFKKYLEVKHL